MNDDEVWKTYPEFDFIQGSNLGRVRTLDHYVKQGNSERLCRGHILKQYDNCRGYMYVTFKVSGKQVHLYVHRIIASCFLPNTDKLEQVNHKNAVRTDNRAENLEWCTREYNNAYRNKCGVSYKEAAPKSPVTAINLTSLEVLQFESQREAARQLGADVGNINKVIKGCYKQQYGYWFTNADSNAVESARVKFGDSVASKVEKLLNKEE